MENVVGREGEITLFSKIERSGEPELVAVYGRRRVGKTYLIRNVYQQQMAFELSGVHNATLKQQLENFKVALSRVSPQLAYATPNTWSQAFNMLITYLTPRIKKQRKVIFIDEFPWFNTPRSGFMQAFENFWNSWASRQHNLVVVICGSAAAWMVKKVVNNRGGLHNRVTRRIRLLPFTLNETEAYLQSRKVNLDKYQIIQLYMVMGGIPMYLREVEPGESATQAIDRTCFTKDGLLQDEFNNLFRSLFDEASVHMLVIKALAKKNSGLTRNEIIAACKLTSGGGATQILDELTESGFITPYIPFGKTAKDNIYKLTDEYSRFYLKFIEGKRHTGAGTWIRYSVGASWKSWSGFAFESICMKHTPQIKKALGIDGVHTETSVWRFSSRDRNNGTQIDLLIDRQDSCINICEIKFWTDQFEITKSFARELENKRRVFRENVRTRKTLFLTMVTSHGLKNSQSFPGLIQNDIKMDALFK